MKLPLSQKRFFIILLAILVVFVFNLFSTEVRGFFYSFSSPFHSLFWQAGKGISDFFEGVLRTAELKRENEMFREDRLSLAQRIIELQAIEEENIQLRNALDLGIEKDFEFLFADIIGKNIGEDTLIIGVGRAKGVEEGMAVMSAGKVAIGRVSEVSDGFSKVRLLSHKKSSFDVQIPEKKTSGIVKGQGGYKLLLDLVPQEQEISTGNLVVTSSLGGIFPENLLVGTVAEILKSGAEPFRKAFVRPFFDIRAAKSVFVITGANP